MLNKLDSRSRPNFFSTKSLTVLGEVLASHEDAALKHLQQLLAPCSIGQFYTDGWGAYVRLLDQQRHTVGKTNTREGGIWAPCLNSAPHV